MSIIVTAYIGLRGGRAAAQNERVKKPRKRKKRPVKAKTVESVRQSISQ